MELDNVNYLAKKIPASPEQEEFLYFLGPFRRSVNKVLTYITRCRVVRPNPRARVQRLVDTRGSRPCSHTLFYVFSSYLCIRKTSEVLDSDGSALVS